MKTLQYLNKTKFFILAITAITFSSCSNDDNPVNEEEVITTVTATLTNGVNVITLSSRDLDGDGPNAPVITVSGNLSANTTYSGTVSFLNETADPIDNITTEILEEGVDHQLFFQAPSALGTFTYNDTDANGKPIGLQFSLLTGNAGSGNLTITLRHLPNKSASGVTGGDITNAGGATDAQVTYPIIIN
ncbi:MAG: type 1 periplasmic binding fold superfamily protein [Flavobacterium sp. JAD_PAG50586_2]|nr:MAG: type 1 periplasmic binding fold superfamily protein [Flavobacterium sp. JAD_PAG50586_2]